MEGLIMAKIIGICDLHDDPHLGMLTKTRPCGAVSFLGRYGLIDFTLSNFSNSHIEKVYVLVKSGILQLRDHIGNGAIWTNNTKTGFIKLLINEEGLFLPKFNTDIANIRINLPINEKDFDYAVISPSFMLTNMDYAPIIEEHIASGSDVTIVYKHVENAKDEFVNCDALTLNEDGEVRKIEKHLGKKIEANISLESFVVSSKILKKIVEVAPTISELYSLREVISALVLEGEITARGHKYEGYVAPILDFDHYISNSFDLLNHHNRAQLFLDDWPIYTTTHNTPPTLYGAEAKVKHCFIANGSVIKGKVEGSIISRGVTIERGAKVKNCIIFTGTEIGRNADMEYVLCDKASKVNTVKELKGTKENVLYISKGAKI